MTDIAFAARRARTVVALHAFASSALHIARVRRRVGTVCARNLWHPARVVCHALAAAMAGRLVVFLCAARVAAVWHLGGGVTGARSAKAITAPSSGMKSSRWR